ncbi:MAG: tRNA guanosine(34) transglycosylase Tgt [Oscillospiraceae bacterium]|jgi:queuine tRNA-ribosyltransferase|nr:tRNA guanosine(34) transglycosylase Tgt [Oscillospiraceae bacterium]
MSFVLLKTEGRARRGVYRTAHGEIQTPVFMNVATQAAIKGGLSSFDLADVGCQVALCNTYHLHLRPGEEIVRALGGLHGFMRWPGPMLTDSGGFQVFSLASLRRVTEEGVWFASHIDGRRLFLGPEESMAIQASLGADIAMAFDECVSNPAPRDYVEASCARTARWLTRCRDEWRRLTAGDGAQNPDQALFGINQGGTYDDLRVAHMREIAALALPGYAIGGLAVGESTEEMYRIISLVEPHMPADRPRYLMGVGTPGNLLEAVARGMDFFDCVLPARNARHGHLYTEEGCLNIKNEKYARDAAPVDAACGCPLCRHFSRAYLRHLFKAGEILALRLSVLHNLFFYNRLMAEIRGAIDEGRFESLRQAKAERLDRRI